MGVARDQRLPLSDTGTVTVLRAEPRSNPASVKLKHLASSPEAAGSLAEEPENGAIAEKSPNPQLRVRAVSGVL